jgi:hypothetical protein
MRYENVGILYNKICTRYHYVKVYVHFVISFSLLTSKENMRLCITFIWLKVGTFVGLL